MPFGGYRRQLQVVVDRNRLAAYGLSITAIRDAIDKYNVAKPGGTLTSGNNESIVRVDHQVDDAGRSAETCPCSRRPSAGTAG